MCGRFTLHAPESQIRDAFNLEHTEPLGLELRYNIAPSQDIPIVRDIDTGPEMILARWGLVPSWSKESKSKYSTINARIESVAEKPTYRTPFKRRRCLIPADGFYEWRVVNGHKIPHHIVPVVRVLFFDDSYQAGYLAEDLVCPDVTGYVDQAGAPVLLAGKIISVSLMVVSVHRSLLAAFSGAIYAIQ